MAGHTASYRGEVAANQWEIDIRFRDAQAELAGQQAEEVRSLLEQLRLEEAEGRQAEERRNQEVERGQCHLCEADQQLAAEQRQAGATEAEGRMTAATATATANSAADDDEEAFNCPIE